MGDRRARAIRGATTVESDSPEQIRRATRELLETIVARNGITSADVVSAIFTVTHDITSYTRAKLFSEIPVPGSLGRCIRVLLHVETDVPRTGIRHVYLHDARTLRPDLAGES